MNTDISKLYFVRSQFNPSDKGTRPNKVLDEDVGPNSVWEKGLPWMNESLEKALDEDILKPAAEVSAANTEDEIEFERGFIIEKDLEILVRGHNAEQIDQYKTYNADRVDKMVARAQEANYLFMPKFSFAKVVRITSIIFKYVDAD